jgi:hypothetical protein
LILSYKYMQKMIFYYLCRDKLRQELML